MLLLFCPVAHPTITMHSQPPTQRRSRLPPTQLSPTREPAGTTSCLPHRCSTSTPPASALLSARPLASVSTRRQQRTFHYQRSPRQKHDGATSCPASPTILSAWAGYATQTAPPSWIRPASPSTTPQDIPFCTDSVTKRGPNSGASTYYTETQPQTQPHAHPSRLKPNHS